MKDQIELFIADKGGAWSPTTLRSERYRLLGIIDFLDGDPLTLWNAIQGQKPYSRVTTWTRAMTFWDWLMKKGLVDGREYQGLNPYREFRSSNARLFKNCYQPKLSDLTLDEAKERIALLTDPEIRAKALDILLGGNRWSDRVDHASNQIVGKGGKVRPVFGKVSHGNEYDRSYQTFWRHLNRVGLKPHELRKVAASVVAKHLSVFDLCRMFGWKDARTAQSYVLLSRDPELRAQVRKILK